MGVAVRMIPCRYVLDASFDKVCVCCMATPRTLHPPPHTRHLATVACFTLRARCYKDATWLGIYLTLLS